MPLQTQSRQEKPNSNKKRKNEQKAEIWQLNQIIKNLESRFENIDSSFTKHAEGISNYIEQIHTQLSAILPNSTITHTPKLLKVENFNRTRSKLRGFLTQINIHLNINKFKLVNKSDKIIFVSTYLQG